ncbi:oxidoreductase, short-chain dehydrogenase/reductase family [Aspergillus chevalieri]|uniref:Short-chain dehydrogenase n=1 Tax=Aspergillus chevalieri TaxID=182096 RepID=A0A7R7VII1_ASPCH|nr:uncharacterized protein ACHE_20808A [Aspergillus chevalieri]BCR85350.1 hypothetical protein ACHE_20808A [Aspergillus chevalieri]
MGIFLSKSVSFNPSTNIPSLEGKVILVRGGNSGLGKESVLELSKHKPKEIWLAARQVDKANESIEEIKNRGGDPARIKVVQLDLMSLESVAKAAESIRAQTNRLDMLLLNAGIMSVPPGLTCEGYEIQFGTNHMGHALLTKLLLPMLLRTREQLASDVRVIVLSSYAHNFAPTGGIVFDSLKSRAEEMGTVTRYGQSKLANLLYGQELARHYRELRVAAVHPGLVRTNLANTMGSESLIKRFLWWLTSGFAGVDPATGALNQLWAATADTVQSGVYYEPVGIANRESQYAKDSKLARELWDWTEQELSQYIVT